MTIRGKVLCRFFVYGYLHKTASELGVTAEGAGKVKMERKNDNVHRESRR